MLGVLGWVYRFRPVHNAVAVESEQTVPHFRRRLPVIALSIKVSIEEFLQVIVYPCLVYIIPLLSVVNPEPVVPKVSDIYSGITRQNFTHHLSFDDENRNPLTVPSVCSIVE